MVGNDPVNVWDFLGWSGLGDIIKRLDNSGTDGEDCRTLCEKIADRINELANAASDYNEFANTLHGSDIHGTGGEATKIAKNFGREYFQKHGISDKGYKSIFNDYHGFKPDVMFNGAENIKHFAGVLKYGKPAAIVKSVFDDGYHFFLNMYKGNFNRAFENAPEVVGNKKGAEANSEIKKALNKDGSWYMLNEYNDEAWDKNKHKVAKEWRKKFCKD